MKIMTGIDLPSNSVLCGLMEENGRRLVDQKLPCDLPSILRLDPYKERIATVAIESTYNWYWLADGLRAICMTARPARCATCCGAGCCWSASAPV